MESITVYYDTPFTLPANGFTRTDEDGDSGFVGWNEEPTKDSYFKHFSDEETVTENLTDEDGAEVILYAIWDYCPWIVADDLYFTLDMARNGEITEDLILSYAEAYDRENSSGTMYKIEPGVNPAKIYDVTGEYDAEATTSFTLTNYTASLYTQFKNGEGMVSETYQVIDHYGNVYKKMINVFIVDTSAKDPEEYTITV